MKIAIIGAGIVGTATAHALLDEDHEVLIVDKEGPAFGPSRGNAGIIAHTDVLPIASPNMLRKVPGFLLDPLGPLAIRLGYLPQLLPWLARFLLAARPAAYERSIAGIIAIQQLALPAWLARAEKAGISNHIHRRGALYTYRDYHDTAGLEELARRQRAAGIAVDMLGPQELRQMEPALKDCFAGAAFHSDAAHISDPLALTMALFEAALARGATFEKAEVNNISMGERPALVGPDGWQRVVDRVIVATGAWSKPLAAAMGDNIPLDTERGYNVSFPGVTGLTSRPVGFKDHGFVMTPLESGLRIGGAVEFGGLQAAPNHARTKALYDKAATLVDGLPAFDSGRLWMGFRPSLPDSLPVIGKASRNPNVVYTFGHGHYGMTQSTATADLVAALIAGRQPAIDLGHFSPQRF
ncbi:MULTISPECIES: NAD(P)/FAD-dependent oxidoreductase [unclassified Bosea (in: a-proteobacteria)]|uniref:FAD-binding oxidoreductase n=1 Tax=unclassified Bosea (in: a-proteobacteria) TaxID=2653178 RepID=UPI000F75BB41|nr:MULTISPECIES: NAD(P)/FAD-dependent oxidoreductase [unclassified Bosea (in: a-proteobacteria)]AZO76705.1 amino acid oxidase [Bosea sp. Tri-49]RXT21538.1 amino acid oxidase [Bosea sp. Tri-39]RXT31877.1 amino acid oxidase [Bosea sp. Tri-54]